jgi:superfamily II DNA or RNA helicase
LLNKKSEKKLYIYIYIYLIFGIHAELAAWNNAKVFVPADIAWHPEQVAAFERFEMYLKVSDAQNHKGVVVYIKGPPGCGKTAVFIELCVRAAAMGLYALVLCPTGPLVHQYRLLLPDSERIVVETIHSAMRISPHSADVVEHAPPSRLNRYDLILLDEGSQVVSMLKKNIYIHINMYI